MTTLKLMLIDFNISKDASRVDSPTKGQTKKNPAQMQNCFEQLLSKVTPDSAKNIPSSPFSKIFLTHEAATPAFAAPEVFKKELYSESVDIWGIGIILHSMIFKEMPSPYSMPETFSKVEDEEEF